METIKVKKKSSNVYVVTRRYKYYPHWSMKQRGLKPTYILNAKIKLKKSKYSGYGFVIDSIRLE